MTREAIHQLFLKKLFAATPRKFERVRVVSRLCNSQLLGAKNAKNVFLFIPDFHLLSVAGETRYRYGFKKLSRQKGIDRPALMRQLLKVALDFRADPDLPGSVSFAPIQTGDILDLWREREREEDSINALVTRIADDNDIVETLVSRSTGALKPRLLTGNHDLRMNTSTLMKRAKRAFGFKQGGEATLLVTHGDVFDPWETKISDGLSEWAVERFSGLFDAGEYIMNRRREGDGSDPRSQPRGAPPVVLTRPQDAAGLDERINVWQTTERARKKDLKESHQLLPGALDSARVLRRAPTGDDAKSKTLRRRLDPKDGKLSMPELRTIVVGHSHHARICIHNNAADPSDNLVLMDCGAWLENSDFRAKKSEPKKGAVVPSCQFGVLCGGDARIYQLDPKASLLHPS